MKLLLLIYLLSLISCSAKNGNIRVNDLCKDTAHVNIGTKIIHNDTSFVTVFLDYDFLGEVCVFDEASSCKGRTVRNDIERENVVMFDLLAKNDSLFYVIAYWALDNEIIAKGWIRKESHLGVFSAAYDKTFVLYEEPNRRSKVVLEDEEYNSDIYEVTDFEGKWLKINAKIRGQVYSGWMPPELQCSNVYSTCN